MSITSPLGARTHPTSPRPSTHPVHKIVPLRGKIDIAATPVLRERLNHALDMCAGRHRRLIIDLSGVSFCDTSGLALLIGTQRRARRLATPVCLAAPPPQVMRLLHITGLDRGLTIHPNLTAAIHARPAPTFASAPERHGGKDGTSE
jgi:anti-sigma B factor antagonist